MLVKTLKDVGAVLRDARKAQGVTQTELAEKLGIRQSWISDLESGRNDNPRLGTVLQVCRVLGVEIRAERGTQEIRPFSVVGDLATTKPSFLRRGGK